MAAMYDGDNNRVFQIDNTYKWEDCYGDDVLIPKSERTENGDSPQEELASLVKGGANAKGYTLTEYVNDVNRENTEVLAEYKADGTMRQAYTYGESGNGERIGVDKVDKSTETSYYMYDGRGSVTGLMTNDGKLTNSYTYDPYGTLTSGTADAVNYYGYNAESTNTKTGLQYLRARYYDPENGNFTSEDTEDGELPFPLTRNRYVYALNNPLNYKDPTGHKSKGVGRAISGAVGGVMGSVFNSTKTVKKIDKPVKNIASFQRKSVQRETGNASGVASGYSKGGNAFGSTSGHSKGGNLPASDSAGNKAGNMAYGNTGNLAGKSGVTGNQRPGYKEQMARMRMEQSKKVTCAAGQKNATAGVLTGLELAGALPGALILLGAVVLLVLGGLLVGEAAISFMDWADTALDFIPISITQETKPTEHDGGDIEVWSGDVVDANGHVVSFAGGGNLEPNRNKNDKELMKKAVKISASIGVGISALEVAKEAAGNAIQGGASNLIDGLSHISDDVGASYII